MLGLPKGLFEFQEDCVNYLLEATSISLKDTTVVKAPTGAGKTIILIDFINKYLSTIDDNTVFIWLCPGTGNLEEQSRQKMQRHIPNRSCKNLFDALISGFQGGDTVFINWELVTNKNNKATTESERKNLFERIRDAHKNNLKFILIVDEEHSNDTKKAKDIINAFVPIHRIRVSATTKENRLYNFYEIPEVDVINSGLITRALYINEDVEVSTNIYDEHAYLIDRANEKRKAIANAYRLKNKNIRPLIMIQFPDMSDDLIEHVESKLDEMGYNYENKLVAKWMSESCDKINISGIKELDARPVFLLMKQAIATGWDCPRAKILVKLRENMSENFTIQTIGRLRRMPEATHYDIDLLDNCYLYTFDVKRVHLKEKCKTFTLEKQMKDLDFDGLGERETYKIAHQFFKDKYNLTTVKKDNKTLLEVAGYRMTDELIRKARQIYKNRIHT